MLPRHRPNQSEQDSRPNIKPFAPYLAILMTRVAQTLRTDCGSCKTARRSNDSSLQKPSLQVMCYTSDRPRTLSRTPYPPTSLMSKSTTAQNDHYLQSYHAKRGNQDVEPTFLSSSSYIKVFYITKYITKTEMSLERFNEFVLAYQKLNDFYL